MKVEIIFHSASAPKVCDDVDSVYTKGGLLCVQHSSDGQNSGLLMKYPLLNVFSIASYHENHLGITRNNENERKLFRHHEE